MSTTNIRFRSKNQAAFFPELRKAVDQYFKDNNKPTTADAHMVIKTIIILGACVGIYLSILFLDISLFLKLILAIGLGFVTALIGVNICHDAIHGSFSKTGWINKSLGLIFNVIGANAYMWHIMHNIVHHTYTNIKGVDEDIEVAPGLIRIHEEDELKSVHRFQHIYAFPLYGLASLAWVFRKDFVKFFKKEIGNYKHTAPPKIEIFNLFFFKLLYFGLFLVIPYMVLEISIWQLLAGFVALHLAEGLTLGMIFQPAHVVDTTAFPMPDQEGNMEDSWAVHQMKTTANFAVGNPIVTWLAGGLNMQIEHHLFPGICHTHYPALTKIVKSVAQKHNVPYNEYPTFGSALKAHYQVLKTLGKDAYESRST